MTGRNDVRTVLAPGSTFNHGLIVSIPLLILTLALGWKAISWVQYGLDLPFFDDWRGYYFGNIDSLSLSYLFAPVNDTLAPIGLALDASVQRFLNGNSILYQALSMLLVLGLLVWSQARLIVNILAPNSIVFACLLSLLLALQTGSYWGRENLAYHQALPVLALSLALLLLWSRVKPWLVFTLSALLGLIAGLSYISGALAGVAAGACLTMFGFLQRRIVRSSQLPHLPLSMPIGWLAGTGVTALFQAHHAVIPVLSSGTIHIGVPLASPLSQDFWWYMLGKIGRSLGLDPNWAMWALGISLIATLLWIYCLSYLVLRTLGQRNNDPVINRLTPIIVAWSAALVCYLGMVSAARALARDDSIVSGLHIFQFGFERFHFFWLTVLWPWILAAFWKILSESRMFMQRTPLPSVICTSIVVCGLIAVITRQSILDHRTAFREQTVARLPTVECLTNGLSTGGPIVCNEFNLADFRLAYIHAADINASFVRYFPIPNASENFVGPALHLNDVNWPHHAGLESRLANVGFVDEFSFGKGVLTEADPQIEVLDLPLSLSSECRTLEVEVQLSKSVPSFAQLFFLTSGADGYSESASLIHHLKVPGNQRVRWTVTSTNGFENRLRVDPTALPQTVVVKDMSIRCRMPTRATLLRDLPQSIGLPTR